MFLFKHKKSIFLLTIIAYFSINLLFNFNLWKQIIEPQSNDKIISLGESPFYEYIAEKVYQNIKSGHNPFSPAQDVLYPFGWNYALDDSATINGFMFVFLRPFLSIHKSYILILLMGIFLSYLSMFYLLKLLGIKNKTAFLMGLIYGFTPFLAIRIGHPTYTALYIFPMLMILILKMYRAKFLSKYIYVLLLGLALNITLLLNIYFTLQIIIICIVTAIYYLLTNKRFLFDYIKKEYKYIIFSLILVCFLLLPWFIKAKEVLDFSQYTLNPGITDSITYSADLFGIFKGGNFNPFFTIIKVFFSKTNFYNNPIFENYIYPGIIIILFYLIIFIFKNKLPKLLLRNIKPFLIISIFFWLLTLGPYLHIFGWNSHIPLPYILINKLPLIQLARAPGRFIVPFIFLSSITVAFIINYFIEIKFKKIGFLFLFLFILFFIDQRYFVSSMSVLKIPVKIYQYLSTQKTGTLLEIPFVIRDGLQYVGSYNNVNSSLLQLYHKKPIFGVYAGRINEDIFTYFRKDPLIGYFAELIDSGKVNDINYTKMLSSIDFFNVENIILKTDEKYSQKSQSIIERIGYKKIMSDYNYDLYFKKNRAYDFDQFDLNSPIINLFLGQGWSDKEKIGKWAVGNTATILFNEVNIHPVELRFNAKAATEFQEMQIFINKEYYDKIYINQGYKTYTIKLNKHLKKGVNIITLTFAKTIQPSTILNNGDKRPLAVFFSELSVDKVSNKSNINRQKPEINKIDFTSVQNESYLLEGWSDYEKKARWVEGKQAKVDFPIYKARKPTKLLIRAEAIVKPQRVKIYINDIFVQSVIIKHGITEDYLVTLNKSLKNGSNIITFKLDNAYLLGKVTGNNNDIRYVSVLVKYLALKN